MMGEEYWRNSLIKEPSSSQNHHDPRRFSLQFNQRIRSNFNFPSKPAQPQYVPAMMQNSDNIPLAIVGLSPRKEMLPRKKVSMPARAISQDQHNLQQRKLTKKKELFYDRKEDSSSTSGSSSGAGYKSHHRHTMPFIMTTGKWHYLYLYSTFTCLLFIVWPNINMNIAHVKVTFEVLIPWRIPSVKANTKKRAFNLNFKVLQKEKNLNLKCTFTI